ncbi:sigma-54 dependent transcriptional regulator [Caulobacter sp. NIBR1757]|uniref:sigma-54-dependent transcriptional regulator n=1 Tax=Caulobacter sp. NIBR1757 TaxID=3016000 RepID=UPI0022F03501|nr:sigma-54 dependent transcriptional regulator [Caulobacter sp. NIBR1757]WGM38578.1 C4-dicarboxylate transport transcriptional regulatory protein DctD [Caulobacter sp. NIBR1757]
MFQDLTLVAFVDDDADLRAANAQGLKLAGLEVLTFERAETALERLDANFPGVVVSDIRMPGMDGRQLFARLRDIDPDLPVILITGHGDVAQAVEAMREGAYDFVAKPYASERLVSSVRRALEKRRLVLDNRRLMAVTGQVDADQALIGETAVMQRLRATLRQIAEAGVDVLLEGETGVGKELAAQALHRWSRRRPHPFVAVNCAALPEAMVESELFGHETGAFSGAMRRRGHVESADRGTLFLDEIESMAPGVQGRMLRVLEEREVTPLGSSAARPVDLRVVAASKGDLAALSATGAFRADLYYRLNVVRLSIPPLRERRDDVPLLFGHFLREAAARFRREPPALTDAVRRRLMEHDWPGNVRELSHFAERVVLGIEEPAPAAPAGGLSLAQRVDAFEAQLLREALEGFGGDVQAALAALDLPRRTFYEKLRRHGIEIARYRER